MSKTQIEDETDIETSFEQIHEHRMAIAVIDEPYNKKINALNAQMEILIQPLIEERSLLISDRNDAADKHTEAVEVLTEEIKEAVLDNGKSCSTTFGTCTHVKGREGAVKWDDAALMGYVSASPDNETILQFRSEKPDGKPSTRFTLVDIK